MSSDDLPLWNPGYDFSSVPLSDGYLREVNSNPLYSNNTICDLGTFPEINDNLDVTGSSAYEDSSLIQAAINRGKQMRLGRSASNDIPFVTGGDNRSGYSSPVFDLHSDGYTEGNQITSVDSPSPTPPTDGYQFPSELDIHPVNFGSNIDSRDPDYLNDFKAQEDIINSCSTQPDVYDEPPLGLLTFAPKQKDKPGTPPPPSYNNIFNPPPVHSGPPPANERSSSVEPVPRPRMNTTPTHSYQTGKTLPASMRNDPPLPRRNNPARANGQNMEPPLPPRNPTRVTTSPSPSTGVTHTPPPQRLHQREQMILELVKLGYSRSEVVKALAIAQNSTELAKKILESFGSRKD